MATSPISTGGAIDVNGIVSSLMDIERQPLQRLEQRASGLRSTISEFGRLQSAMDKLQTTADELTRFETFRAANGASSNEDAVGISAAAGALQGNFAVKVNELASYQTIVSQEQDSFESVIGGGTLTIQFGTNDGGFTANPDRDPIDISIAAGSTMAEVSAAINSADAGIGASLVTDADGTRLMLRSSESGKEQAFSLTGTTDGTGEGFSLADLSYSPGQAAGTVQATQDAANAQFELNGLALESATNRPEGILENVTLSLKQKTDTAVDVEVVSDSEAIREKVDGFIEAYNELNSLIRTQTGFNAETQTAGPLQGNRMVLLAQTKIREIVTGQLEGVQSTQGPDGEETTPFTRLTDIGIELSRDGSLSLNESRFETNGSNLTRVGNLFSATGDENTDDGFARQLDTVLGNLLGIDGAVSGATETLRAREQDLEDQQERFERRLTEIESRLVRQYSSLDSNLAVLQGALQQVSRLG
ncbi:MAG: flagellar filament capping protein FliD [Burkholderiaceae bacterium]